MTGPLTEEQFQALRHMLFAEVRLGLQTRLGDQFELQQIAVEHSRTAEQAARRALVSDTSEQAISIFDPETPKPPEKPWSEVWAGVDGNTRGDDLENNK